MVRVFTAAMMVLFSLSGGVWAKDIELGLPVRCEVGRTCAIQHYVDRDPGPAAKDYQCGTMTYNAHSGTDIRLPTLAAQKARVDVLAAAGGRVLRVRNNMPDVSIRAAGAVDVDNRECGNGLVIQHADGWETQYCHLAQGSIRVKPGTEVRAGEPIGRVGLSGDTEFPHLHFTLRHQGKVVDPFAHEAAPDSCGGGASLWGPKLEASLAYKAGEVLNAGFAAGALTMADIDADAIQPPGREAPAVVAFVRAIGLRGGDVQRLVVNGPDGRLLAERTDKLDRNKAQAMMFVGRKRPPQGWARGSYAAVYSVMRDGRVVIDRRFDLMM